MVTLEELAQAALERDSLRLRSLTQDFLSENPRLSDYARPATNDLRVLSTAAALIELFALRKGQSAPLWTKDVGPLDEPFFLLESAAKLKRLRAFCEAQAPLPLRRRRLFAPPNFLEFA
jgi:hypothetical protein